MVRINKKTVWVKLSFSGCMFFFSIRTKSNHLISTLLEISRGSCLVPPPYKVNRMVPALALCWHRLHAGSSCASRRAANPGLPRCLLVSLGRSSSHTQYMQCGTAGCIEALPAHCSLPGHRNSVPLTSCRHRLFVEVFQICTQDPVDVSAVTSPE